MSLRLRVALIMAMAIALSLCLQGILGYITFSRLVVRDMDHDLKLFARDIAQQVQKSQTLENLELDRERYIVHARLLEGQKLRFLLTSFPSDFDPSAAVQQNQTLGIWRIQNTPIVWQGQSLTLQTILTSPEFTNGLRNHRNTMLFSAFLVVLLAACLAYGISGYALRPLQALTRISSRIAASGSLKETVPIPPQASGEIFDLAVAFNRMLERLSEFRLREAAFNRHAAHELRSPLTAMRLSVDAARSGYLEPKKALEVLHTELGRTQKLTASLLILAKEGHLAQSQTLDIAVLAQQCAQAFSATYQGVESALVEGDEVLLQRVLENLLENTQQHAPGAQMYVGVELKNQRVEVSVSDNGPGLPEAILPHLTQAFYQANTLEKKGGSGLGLSVVQHVMRAHQGDVAIENIQPHGLRVRLVFPTKPG